MASTSDTYSLRFAAVDALGFEEEVRALAGTETVVVLNAPALEAIDVLLRRAAPGEPTPEWTHATVDPDVAGLWTFQADDVTAKARLPTSRIGWLGRSSELTVLADDGDGNWRRAAVIVGEEE